MRNSQQHTQVSRSSRQPHLRPPCSLLRLHTSLVHKNALGVTLTSESCMLLPKYSCGLYHDHLNSNTRSTNVADCRLQLKKCQAAVRATQAKLQQVLAQIKQTLAAPAPIPNECNPQNGCNVCSECCAAFIPDGPDCDQCARRRCKKQTQTATTAVVFRSTGT